MCGNNRLWISDRYTKRVNDERAQIVENSAASYGIVTEDQAYDQAGVALECAPVDQDLTGGSSQSQ